METILHQKVGYLIQEYLTNGTILQQETIGLDMTVKTRDVTTQIWMDSATALMKLTQIQLIIRQYTQE